ncbi:MAG: hypothetical protein RR726_12210 [Pseudomonas sp.]
MRDLGNAGEARVQEWCALAGITVNKVGIDRHGWDLYFEMPAKSDLSTASRLHESAYECKVQVKTTGGGLKSVSVELSNLHAMATTALPSFYLLVVYDNDDVLVSAHLLHIDELQRERILSRIRKEMDEDESTKLNKKTMSLNFADKMQIQPLNGHGIKSAIISCIGDSQARYVSSKQRHLASVGYESGMYSIKFQVADEDIKRFVGMATGDGSKVKVKKFQLVKTRFGICDKTPSIQRETALISISDLGPRERGRMFFRSLQSGSKIEWEVDVFRAALADWIPEQHRLMRMRAHRFTFDIRPDGREITFWIHKKDAHPSSIRELLKFYKLLAMMQECGGVEVVLEAQGRELRSIATLEKFKDVCDYSDALNVVKAVQQLQAEYGCYEDLIVAPKEISERQQDVLWLMDIISGEADLVSGGCDSKLSEVVVPDFLKLGNIYFASLLVLRGERSDREGVGELAVSSQRLIYKAYCRDEPASLEAMVDEVKERSERYQGDVPVENLTRRLLQ